MFLSNVNGFWYGDSGAITSKVCPRSKNAKFTKSKFLRFKNSERIEFQKFNKKKSKCTKFHAHAHVHVHAHARAFAYTHTQLMALLVLNVPFENAEENQTRSRSFFDVHEFSKCAWQRKKNKRDFTQFSHMLFKPFLSASSIDINLNYVCSSTACDIAANLFFRSEPQQRQQHEQAKTPNRTHQNKVARNNMKE